MRGSLVLMCSRSTHKVLIHWILWTTRVSGSRLRFVYVGLCATQVLGPRGPLVLGVAYVFGPLALVGRVGFSFARVHGFDPETFLV